MTVPMIDTVSKSAGTITRRCRRNRPCQTNPLYGPEHLFIGAIALKPALADVVPQAVQRQLARFDLLRHKGERHQVLKRGHNSVFLKLACLLFRVFDVRNRIVFRAQDIHPPTDKAVFGIQRWRVAFAHVQTALHTATAGVTEHDNMRDFQRLNRIFNRGRRPVLLPVRLIRWHQVGDITVNKEFTLIRPKDRCYMHAAIAARNDHRTRMLPVAGQTAVPCLVFSVTGCFPSVIPLNQIIRERFRVIHLCLAFTKF